MVSRIGLELERDEARDKALDSLSRYKFMQFGYWAAIWVHLNRLIGDRQRSPFQELVQHAKRICAERGIGMNHER